MPNSSSRRFADADTDLGEYVLIVGRTVARGRESGVQTSTEDAWLIRFEGGSATEYREYTKQEALDAVGLSE